MKKEKKNEETLSETKQQVKSNMMLAYECIQLLWFLTQHNVEPFLDKYIVPRIAVLINTYLENLVGRGAELKVENKQEYHFDPKFLLTTIIKIFVGLSGQDVFLEAIVEDDAHF